MYKIHTDHTQARTHKLPQDYKKTNKRVSFSTGVIPTTSVSRPQLKSNPQGDRVLRSNSRGKKLEVEEHCRNVKLPKNKTSVTACNDSLNAKTLNVKSVSAMFAKYVMIDKYDLCVPKFVAKPLKKTVASESIKKPRNNVRKLHERFEKMYKWSYIKFTPSGYMWKPKSTKENVNLNVSMPLGNVSRTANVMDPMTSMRSTLVEIVLFIVDSGYSKHMTRNLKLLINFVEKFLGTVKFGNYQIAPILGNGDLVQGVVTIKRVYYVEGLNHNLFSIGQFCDADLEVAFRKSTCYIRDLKGNDLLTASLSQAWLWHRRLSHLNFDTINLLSKNDIVVGLPKLKFVKDHLCSSCEYTWTHFLRSKDETPEVLIDFLRLVQRGLQAQVRVVRTDNGTEILNQTLHAYFAAEGIHHQTSVARTPKQNGVVERRNRTLVEAARTMLSAAKVPLFFWAKAIATACFTQNCSLVIPRHEKTPYHIINNRKPSVKFYHNFGSLCYIVRDGENLDKMKDKGDECILWGFLLSRELTESLTREQE
nr:hypothetical protein [Tanacetum cinerariifolium]